MKYGVFIFDLDGTLYHQLPVRIFMALCMIFYYMLRPHKIREFFAVLKYRRLREELFGNSSENFSRLQILKVSELCGIEPLSVERAINFWMNERPLKVVKLFRRRKLLELMKRLQSSGKVFIIYSDYPVKEKLETLKFTPDYYFWSNDGVIDCMKPDSSGILRAVDTIGIEKKKILYVGDRYNRDGLCAEGAGIDYMDVKEFLKKFLVYGDVKRNEKY